MRQLIYGVLNTTTNKVIYTNTSKTECEEHLKTMSNKDELKICFKWRNIQQKSVDIVNTNCYNNKCKEEQNT